MSYQFGRPTERQGMTELLQRTPSRFASELSDSDSGSESESESESGSELKIRQLEKIRRKLGLVQQHGEVSYAELLRVDDNYQQLRQQHAFLSDQHAVLLHQYQELMSQYTRLNQRFIDDDNYWKDKYDELVRKVEQTQYYDSEDESAR